MASDVAAIERLEEQPIAVDARAIEDEFSRIWRETSGMGYDESSIRVRVLNFVAVAAQADDLDRFDEVMQVLPQRHPCRGVFVASAAPYDRLSATISAHCWRSGGARRHVCSEEIVLTGAPSQERELASAVLGLLVPELPVVIWLMGEPDPQGELAARLIDAGDSAVIDSARCADLRRAYEAVSHVRDDARIACSDLAWVRHAGWRALTAQMFDGAAGTRELQEIRSISVRGGDGALSSEALLLGSWLTSRLRFVLADARFDGVTLDASFYDGTRDVRLSIAPGAGGSALDDLRMRTHDAEFRIERDAKSGHLHVQEKWDSGSMRRTVDQLSSDDGSVMALALDGVGDETFDEAVRMARALLGE